MDGQKSSGAALQGAVVHGGAADATHAVSARSGDAPLTFGERYLLRWLGGIHLVVGSGASGDGMHWRVENAPNLPRWAERILVAGLSVLLLCWLGAAAYCAIVLS